MPLEPNGVDHLLDLAEQRAVGLEEQILGKLLGDGGAALDHAAGLEIAEAGAEEPQRIDAEMLVEAAVFGRDHSARKINWEPVEPHIAAAQAPLGEHGAVARKDGEVGRAVVKGQQRRVGQAIEQDENDRGEHEGADPTREQAKTKRLSQEWGSI